MFEKKSFNNKLNLSNYKYCFFVFFIVFVVFVVFEFLLIIL